jgi:hypothetical protein
VAVVVVVAALMCRRLRSMTAFLSPLVVLALLMFVVAVVVALAVEPFLDFNHV